jgi:rhodanese-related sulfurtransferase
MCDMPSSPHPSLRPVVAALLATALALAGCEDSGQSTPTPGSSPLGIRVVPAAQAVALLDSRSVIDVRTPQEYAAGHIAGAINISVEADDFGARIAELDPHAAYLVYCRSGRRSALAAELMAAAGFTDVADAGGQEALVAAGAQTEQGPA